MESKKVLIVTSNYRGGIAQFAYHLATGIEKSEDVRKVVLMVPNDSEYSASENIQIRFYERVLTNFPKEEKFAKTLGKIEGINPTHIIFAESSLSNMQLAHYLRGKYHISMALHDALLRARTVNFKQLYRESVFQKKLLSLP